MFRPLAAQSTQHNRNQQKSERAIHPSGAVPPPAQVNQPQTKHQHEDSPNTDQQHADTGQAKQERDLGRLIAPPSRLKADARDGHSRDKQKGAEEVEEESYVLHRRSPPSNGSTGSLASIMAPSERGWSPRLPTAHDLAVSIMAESG